MTRWNRRVYSGMRACIGETYCKRAAEETDDKKFTNKIHKKRKGKMRMVPTDRRNARGAEQMDKSTKPMNMRVLGQYRRAGNKTVNRRNSRAEETDEPDRLKEPTDGRTDGIERRGRNEQFFFCPYRRRYTSRKTDERKKPAQR